MKSKRRSLLVVMALVTATRADAAESSSTPESGFGGRLSLGAVFSNVKTNMVAAAGFGLVHLGDASLGSLNGEPKAHNGPLPVVALSMQYSFETTGTQLFMSTATADPLQFDYFNLGGVRQRVGIAGKVSLAYLFALPVRVRADPYMTGDERRIADRRSQVRGWPVAVKGCMRARGGTVHVALVGPADCTCTSRSRNSQGSLLDRR